METKQAAAIYPTVDEINALPEKFRQYIHDLETRCDKSGDVQTIAILHEDRDALQRRVEELEARIALQEREYLEEPIETKLNKVSSFSPLSADLCRRGDKAAHSITSDCQGSREMRLDNVG